MTAWALILAGLAIVFLVVIPVWGAVKFKPHRARYVKYAEAATAVVIEKHVADVRLLHPEIVSTGRIDRHWFYVLPHIGVFAYAICVFTGAQLTSNVTALGSQTRYTMATCFLVGSVLVLAGATLGARVGRRRIVPSIHDHITAEVLGDDITLPYWLACAGLFATSVAAAIYSWTSFGSTTGSLGGWLTGTMAFACWGTIAGLVSRNQAFATHNALLISEAIAQIERRGDALE